MRTVVISFDPFSLSVSFEDEALCRSFSEVFRAKARADAHPDGAIFVRGKTQGDYRVECEAVSECGMTKEQAMYLLTRLIGEKMCDYAQDDVAVLHAASVRVRQGVISLFGSSGSGKTSLSVLLSRYGSYVGDEFAFIDLSRGTIWHEEHPIQLKEGNPVLASLSSKGCTLEVVGGPAGRAHYVSLDALPHEHIGRCDNVPIKALVMPKYVPDGSSTLRRISVESIPTVVLESLLGSRTPADLLACFLRMVSLHNIPLYEISYSDGDVAALRLLEELSCL